MSPRSLLVLRDSIEERDYPKLASALRKLSERLSHTRLLTLSKSHNLLSLLFQALDQELQAALDEEDVQEGSTMVLFEITAFVVSVLRVLMAKPSDLGPEFLPELLSVCMKTAVTTGNMLNYVEDKPSGDQEEEDWLYLSLLSSTKAVSQVLELEAWTVEMKEK